MSIIVAVRKSGRVVMAADSMTCFGDAQRVAAPNAVTAKLRRIGPAVVGGAGWAVYDCIITDYLAELEAAHAEAARKDAGNGADRSNDPSDHADDPAPGPLPPSPPPLDSEAAIFTFFMDLWRAMHDRYPFVNDQAQSKDSPFGDLDSSFLIAAGDAIFKVSSDMDVSRFGQYYAIGSGAEYALGAMWTLYEQLDDPAEIARAAVHAAMAFDVHCGGDVDVQEA